MWKKLCGIPSGDGPNADIRADRTAGSPVNTGGSADGALGSLQPTRGTDTGGKPVLVRLVYPTETKSGVTSKSGGGKSARPAVARLLEDRAFFKKLGIHRHEAGCQSQLTGSAHAELCNGLSRMKGQPSRPVLRGGRGGNAASLPDTYQSGSTKPCDCTVT